MNFRDALFARKAKFAFGDFYASLFAKATGAQPVEKTVSGSEITINDAVGGNASAFSIAAALTQSGSGTPSDDNIRPIVNGNTLTITLNGTAIPITLQTAHGTFAAGTLNVRTGELVVTHECVTLTGEEDVQQAGSTASPLYTFINLVATADYGVTNKGVCSHLAYVNVTSSNPVKGFRFYTSSGNFRLALNPQARSAIADVKTWLSANYANGTPVQAAYELTTPKTYSLTPQEIELVAGGNTVSASMGVITMTYMGRG